METLQRIEEELSIGDRASFDALFERYFDRVYAFVSRRSSSRGEAEACCEQILEIVMKQLSLRPPQVSLDAFVFSVVRANATRLTEPCVSARTLHRLESA